MASGLRHYKAFTAALNQAEAQIREMGAGWSLLDELQKPAPESRVDAAEISQPACTAVQLALVELLRSWGVNPTSVAGHSSGEIAAAFAAGFVSFRGAIALAYYRGQAAARLSRQQSEKGAMVALGVGSEEASRLIQQHAEGYATVAAINSPQSVTVSGDKSAMDRVHKAAEAQGLFSRKLKVEMAYHSRHMEEVAGFYRERIQPFCDEDAKSFSHDATHPAFVSSVTGRAEGVGTVDASYWVRNLVQPVRFADAIQSLVIAGFDKTDAGRKPPNVIVEIGPHAALKNPIKQTVDSIQFTEQRQTPFTYLPSLVRGTDSGEAMLDLAGSLFTLGAPSIQLGVVNNTDKHSAHVLTDLPAYAWDKSTSYEITPRATKEKLFPGEPYHPLLGRKALSNGPSERVYRQVFTLDEIPWIRDHNVAGTVVFPMTGYLSCAIEALRRTASSPPASIVIRDFHAIRSLEIEEEETVDLTTRIRPAATGTGSFSSTTWSFEIATWRKADGWTTHCYGRIEPEAKEMTTETPNLKTSLPLINATNLKEHDAQNEYATAGQRGTRYGPSFQSTVKFFEGEGFTVIEAQLRDLDRCVPSLYGSLVSVDPPTLDGFLQGGGPLQEVDGKRPAQMPNYISRLRVSNKIPDQPQQRFTVVTRLLDYDVKGGRMNISVAAFAHASDGLLIPVADWESVAFRSILLADADDPTSNLPANWCWELVPSIDFLSHEELTKTVSAGDLAEEETLRRRNVNKVSTIFIRRALEETANDDRSKMPHHLSRFASWAARAVEREAIDLSGLDTEKLINEVRTQDAQGELLCAIGEQLVPILREEIQPLEIMLKDGLLTRHYEADVGNAHMSKVLGNWVLSLSDLNPDMRILEIGGGTAGTTMHVLKALSKDREVPALLDYTFTDISSGFFENARVKLAEWENCITYKKLDISQDPVQQGFAQQQFDLVIASNVLHATANMSDTMSNVRRLLKPKGKLLLLEAGRHPPATLPFALLPGWWYAEDQYRDHEEGPLLTVEGWDQLLKDIGFSGVDDAVQDYPGSSEQMLSVMSSTRVGTQDDSEQITVCGPFMEDGEVDFAQMVADAVSDRLDCPTEVKPLAEIDSTDNSYYIFIDSPNHSVFANTSSETFEQFQHLLLHNAGLLWAIPEGGVPECESIKGIFRTFRLENEPKNLLWFDSVPFTEQGVSAVTKLAEKLRDPEVIAGEDQDYVWSDGSIHIPRMRQMKEVKEQFAADQGVPFRKVQNIWSGDRGLEMTLDAAGSPDSIYFRRTDVLQKPLGDDEVIIRVEAAGMSYLDLSLILGSIPWAPPGFDGAGKVIRTGSQVSDIKEGDRVLFLALEETAFATYKKMPSWHVAKIPDGISTTDAAGLPLAYCVAALALLYTAQLRKDETVLIHSAAGAIGQACIVLAKYAGARIFATAGTVTKREFLHEAFDIPEDQIFSSHTSEFRDRILCATDGKGIDVIINSLSGELLTETWALSANYGRFIDISKDAFKNHNLPMRPFNNNVTFSSIDLRDLFKYRPGQMREVFSHVLHLLEQGVISPIKPITVLPISQFATGLRKLRSGDNMGKIIVTLGKDDEVLAESNLRPSQVALKPDATYLITGGTGGIGLNLAYWMIEHGARNVVVLGRSGDTRPEVKKLLKQYEGTDVVVRALACDVGLRSEVANVVKSIEDLPPVRGVIHSALQLRVSRHSHEFCLVKSANACAS